jgi:hypothetical protein
MAAALESKVPTGASLTSLANRFILTKRTESQSPRTTEYYEGILRRFLWYIKQNSIPDDTRQLNEWHIRNFLSYVSSQTNRWATSGLGSESSKNKASYTTIHHYYRVLKTFFGIYLSAALDHDIAYGHACGTTPAVIRKPPKHLGGEVPGFYLSLL